MAATSQPSVGLTTTERGLAAEQAVEAALVALGWQVLARNWSGGGGELDRVILRGDAVRFVEIKSRSESDPLASEAISAAKRARMGRAATAWMVEHEHLLVSVRELCFLFVWYDPKSGRMQVLDNPVDVR